MINQNELIKNFIERLEKRINKKLIYKIYGSTLRGGFVEGESDIDVLILCKKRKTFLSLEDYKEILILIEEITKEYGKPKNHNYLIDTIIILDKELQTSLKFLVKTRKDIFKKIILCGRDKRGRMIITSDNLLLCKECLRKKSTKINKNKLLRKNGICHYCFKNTKCFILDRYNARKANFLLNN